MMACPRTAARSPTPGGAPGGTELGGRGGCAPRPWGCVQGPWGCAPRPPCSPTPAAASVARAAVRPGAAAAQRIYLQGHGGGAAILKVRVLLKIGTVSICP
jgi:hypothetical protein